MKWDEEWSKCLNFKTKAKETKRAVYVVNSSSGLVWSGLRKRRSRVPHQKFCGDKDDMEHLPSAIFHLLSCECERGNLDTNENENENLVLRYIPVFSCLVFWCRNDSSRLELS